MKSRNKSFKRLRPLISKLEQHGEGEPVSIPELPAARKLPVKAPIRPVVIPQMSMKVPDPEAAADTESTVSNSEQKIVDALASLEVVGASNPSKTQLAAFAGFLNPTSGGFAASVAALIRKGLAESSGGKATLTAAGRAVANMPSHPATTKDLQERIFHLLGEGERKMLTLLIAAFPESVTRVELAGQAGYSNAKSGGFAAPLARLLDLGFVESVRPGVVRGSEMLFLKGKGRGKCRRSEQASSDQVEVRHLVFESLRLQKGRPPSYIANTCNSVFPDHISLGTEGRQGAGSDER